MIQESLEFKRTMPVFYVYGQEFIIDERWAHLRCIVKFRSDDHWSAFMNRRGLSIVSDALLDVLNDQDFIPRSRMVCYGPYLGVPQRPNFQVIHECDIEELWNIFDVTYDNPESECKEFPRSERGNAIISIE